MINGNLSVDKMLAINKIGHAMHDLDPECGRIAYKKVLYDIMISIGLKNPTIVQSQYIFKQPKIGAKVNPHTDSTFIYTEPLSCVAGMVSYGRCHHRKRMPLCYSGISYFIFTSRTIY